MPNPKSTRLSRRDTIKILAAAAGAGALANLPNKWTKPGMDFGVLPAHAQSSQIIHTLRAGDDAMIDFNVGQPPITINSTVQITPPDSGIVMRYSVVLQESAGASSPAGIDLPNPLTGTVTTNGGGTGILPITYSEVGPNATITVTWSFENPDDGTGTDDQVFKTPEPVLHALEAGLDTEIDTNVEGDPITITSTVQITPPDPGIVMRYSVTLDEGNGLPRPAGIDSPNPLTGTVATDNTGQASVDVTYSNVWFNSTITVTWSFENPSDGTGIDEQIFQTPDFNP
ncbi:MAG: hypothetical protein HY869_13760 [Chloroflexi bacterium]|nr:hypothetical protein [Chloroflexota bacterium]